MRDEAQLLEAAETLGLRLVTGSKEAGMELITVCADDTQLAGLELQMDRLAIEPDGLMGDLAIGAIGVQRRANENDS